MTQETILANAKLILGDEVVTGSLRMRDGMLAEMGTGTSVPKDAVDRCVLALGIRADVVRVSCIDGVAVTNEVWSQGVKVA